MYTVIASNQTPRGVIQAKFRCDTLDDLMKKLHWLIEEDEKDEEPPRFTEYRVVVGEA